MALGIFVHNQISYIHDLFNYSQVQDDYSCPLSKIKVTLLSCVQSFVELEQGRAMTVLYSIANLLFKSNV